MKIGHVKYTDCAYAPDELVNCINRYSDKYKAELIYKQECDLKKFDIIHWHNRFQNIDSKQCIQYHSLPDKMFVELNYQYKKLVIAQYPATLPEYSDCQLVRNIIDIEKPVYKYKKIDKVKVGYAPTCKQTTGLTNKAYTETIEILKKLNDEIKLEYDIIENVSLGECLQRKSECSIIIDECITGSYHRNALEGLAMGKLTICSIGQVIGEIFKKVSGSDIIPFESIWIEGLYQFLKDLVKSGQGLINIIGERNYLWFRTFWNPEVIISEYSNIYDNL